MRQRTCADAGACKHCDIAGSLQEIRQAFQRLRIGDDNYSSSEMSRDEQILVGMHVCNDLN